MLRLPHPPEILESRIAPATFIVTNTSDNTDTAHDTGSLRDAISLAVAHHGADVIKFSPLVHGTIFLANGQLPNITDALQIIGPGPSKLTIDAHNVSGIFYANDYSSATDSPVTISGFTLTRGNITSGGGAAIESLESLTVSNCVITNCTAPNGGAIAVYATTPKTASCTISGSQFFDDQTKDSAPGIGGGAILIQVQKTASITGCLIANCSLGNDKGVPQNGAGINVQNLGTGAGPGVILANDVISDNVGGSFGTGAYLHSNKTISISGCTIDQNHSYGAGLAIIAGSASTGVTISHSQISGNLSDTGSGGGIYIQDNTLGHKPGTNIPLSKVTVASSVISGNTIAGTTVHSVGGGIDVAARYSYFIGDQIHDNTCTIHGGGIAADNRVTITGGVISDNTVTVGEGGGVDILSSAAVTITGTQFIGNHADAHDGGGAFIGTATLKITGATFSGNTASYAAGADLLSIHTGTISSSTFSGNSSKSSVGGLGINASAGHITIQNTRITGNLAANNAGGGNLYAGTLKATGLTVTGNVANGIAGGLEFSGPEVFSLQSSLFTGNSAISNSTTNIPGNGGGIYIANNVSGTISSTRITGNLATSTGGGLFNKATGGLVASISQLALITGNIASTDPDHHGI